MTGDLVVRARQSGVDQCNVAIEAMPGYVLGDLPFDDAAWIEAHTSECRSCDRERAALERVGDLIEELDRLDPGPAPSLQLECEPVAKYTRMESPIGDLLVAVSDEGVCEIWFGTSGEDAFLDALRDRGFRPIADSHAAAPAVHQLEEYFGGRRTTFDIQVDLSGVTPFTQDVLGATANVAFGSVRTYGDIARDIGKPGASRAVGGALGRNPVPVIIPCHRIVRTDYSLGGYAGGPDIKQGLLAIEGRAIAI